MAPFWDDINIGRSDTISYETFESGYYLEQVNAYIQRQRQNTFQGTWMMNVYYKEVAPFNAIPFSEFGSGVSEIIRNGSEVVSGSRLFSGDGKFNENILLRMCTL